MLGFMENIRNGLVDAHLVACAETSRRLTWLQLSKCRDVERSHLSSVNSLDIEAIDGRYLLSGAADGSILIHDLENRQGSPSYTCNVVCKVHGKSRNGHRYSVEKVQWYPFDTGLFLSSGRDGRLKVWDTNTLVPADTIALRENIFTHHMSTVATNHCLVAVGCAHPHVVLVDLKTGSNTHELRGHQGHVMAIQWSPWDENLLATGSSTGTLLLWDVRSAKGYLKALDQHNGEGMSASNRPVHVAHDGRITSIHFTADGLSLLSYGTDHRVRLWDVATGKNTMANFGKVSCDARKAVQIAVAGVACRPLAFVPSESNVVAFDVWSGEQVGLLQGHFSSVNCCTVHPFYPEVYTGANDRNILVWVDGEHEEAYEEHLHREAADQTTRRSAVCVRRNVTVDTWSSDED